MDSEGLSGPQEDIYHRNSDDVPPGNNLSGSGAGVDESSDSENATDDAWIRKARDIYTTSTDYLTANITQTWERNLSNFHGQHAVGSPFLQKGSKRSNVFRPKTRANIKTQEAAMAMAAFSTSDFADIKPVNPKDENQRASAQIIKELLTYRLEKRMPWFQTQMGAWQDTKNYGICVSHQYWKYEANERLTPVFDDSGRPELSVQEDGSISPMARIDRTVIFDDMCCDNHPPENFLFHPMSDWRDPVKSSPYVILKIPMFLGDVVSKMTTADPKTGAPRWKQHKMADIVAATSYEYDSTRQAREGEKRNDPHDVKTASFNEMNPVWVHKNVVREQGVDIVYYTIGVSLMLTDPIPLKEMYPWLRQGERPFVLGTSTIETHRTYPAGDNEQASGLQQEINIISNQRIDNVRLALNKRYILKRGAQIDLDALMRNTPGGGVFTNDPETDIKTENTQDVTSSSYQEQDRLSTEYDDLVGGFSQTGMLNNQSGGQQGLGQSNIMSSSANQVQDYGIRIFNETWSEKVMSQFVRMIQMFETDEVLLQMAADKVGLFQKFGMDRVTDELMEKELTVRINMGLGNTDPMRRVERLTFGISKIAEIPGMIERVKGIALADEIMGSLGYRDASMYVMTDDEWQEHTEKLPEPDPSDAAIKMREADIHEQDNVRRDERERIKIQGTNEAAMAALAVNKDMKLEELYNKLGIEQEKQKSARDIAALSAQVKNRQINLDQSRAQIV